MASTTTKKTYEKYELYHYEKDGETITATPLYEYAPSCARSISNEYGISLTNIMSAYREWSNIRYSIDNNAGSVGYLVNTSNSFIDTGVKLTTDSAKRFAVEYDAILHDDPNFSSWAIYGYDVPDYSLGMSSGGQFVTEGGATSPRYSGVNDRAYSTKRMVYYANYKTGDVRLKHPDGTIVYSWNHGSPRSLSFYGYGYRLFGTVNNGGSAGNLNCRSKLRCAILWIDGACVRYFVPFYRDSVYGMIDLVSMTFYKNAGGGSFSYQLI